MCKLGQHVALTSFLQGRDVWFRVGVLLFKIFVEFFVPLIGEPVQVFLEDHVVGCIFVFFSSAAAALRASSLVFATAASVAMAVEFWFKTSLSTPLFSASPREQCFFASGVFSHSPVLPKLPCSLALCPPGGTATRDILVVAFF